MLITFAALAALHVASPSQPHSRPECGLRHPGLCQTTNDLVWAKDFKAGLNLFSAGVRTNFLTGRPIPLSVALNNLVGGAPDDPIRLADGNYLFTACMAHNCTEKGALVISRTGSIIAAAMLTNHYVNENDPKKELGEPYARLDYFVRTPIIGEPVWYGRILAWAKSAYLDQQAVFGEYGHSLGLTASGWRISPANKKLVRFRSVKIVGDGPAQEH